MTKSWNSFLLFYVHKCQRLVRHNGALKKRNVKLMSFRRFISRILVIFTNRWRLSVHKERSILHKAELSKHFKMDAMIWSAQLPSQFSCVSQNRLCIHFFAWIETHYGWFRVSYSACSKVVLFTEHFFQVFNFHAMNPSIFLTCLCFPYLECGAFSFFRLALLLNHLGCVCSSLAVFAAQPSDLSRHVHNLTFVFVLCTEF